MMEQHARSWIVTGPDVGNMNGGVDGVQVRYGNAIKHGSQCESICVCVSARCAGDDAADGASAQPTANKGAV